MKTSIIGYPRIGCLRELKFASEKYFRKEIGADELEKTAKEIRKYNLGLQKASGLDFIPSNDFSFYDGVLDTAFLLGAVPERYTSLGLSTLDTYFAAARGYQSESGDVKALAMKKWFNTNYHYIVPEIDDNTQIKLVGTKPFELFEEAKAEGVVTSKIHGQKDGKGLCKGHGCGLQGAARKARCAGCAVGADRRAITCKGYGRVGHRAVCIAV